MGNDLTRAEASKKFRFKVPHGFSFRHTVESHGWYDLAPFKYDATECWLSYTFVHQGKEHPSTIKICEKNGKLVVSAQGDVSRKEALSVARHIFRLDESFDGFYELTERFPELRWAKTSGAGRLLRSSTVFEDLVKSMCTTNCTWALTRKMVENLVVHLGEPSANGAKAFPTPAAMAVQPVDFYREVIRAGYRAEYLAELAERVCSGDLDPESWLVSDLPTGELKRDIKKVKGVGDYAAENLLKLLGRYDGLALDSWLRSGFYKKHNRERKCPDKKIEKHYARFGEWRGLAIWCDMTESWFDEK